MTSPAPAFGVVRVSALEPGDAPHKLNVRIRGSLPRLPMPGECVTLHLARYEKFRGFQVKSAALAKTKLHRLDRGTATDVSVRPARPPRALGPATK